MNSYNSLTPEIRQMCLNLIMVFKYALSKNNVYFLLTSSLSCSLWYFKGRILSFKKKKIGARLKNSKKIHSCFPWLDEVKVGIFYTQWYQVQGNFLSWVNLGHTQQQHDWKFWFGTDSENPGLWAAQPCLNSRGYMCQITQTMEQGKCLTDGKGIFSLWKDLHHSEDLSHSLNLWQ